MSLEPTPAIDAIVFVRYDPQTQLLAFAGAPVVLKEGDSVAWCFLNLPPGFVPDIRFSPVLHPFARMTFSPTVIVGSGARFSEELTYQVFLISPDGAQPGLTGTLRAPSLELEVIHRFTVRLDPLDNSLLLVEPDQHVLHTGEQIEWEFDASCFAGGDIEQWQANVEFVDGSVPLEGEQAYYGPLEMLSKWHESDPLKVYLRGSGNNGVIALYHFRAYISDLEDGRVIRRSSPDPVIDNRNGVD